MIVGSRVAIAWFVFGWWVRFDFQDIGAFIMSASPIIGILSEFTIKPAPAGRQA
jgi:hypothetical protein